jgi:hypothetical protein
MISVKKTIQGEGLKKFFVRLLKKRIAIPPAATDQSESITKGWPIKHK